MRHPASTSPAESSPLPVSVGTLVGLLVSTTLAAMLALFQWMELLLSLAGASPVCDINATFHCQQVWNSAFAKDLQRATHMPVAGWGLVWGLASLVTVVVVWAQVTRDRQAGPRAVFMVRLTALAGVLVSLVMAGKSAAMGTFCLTCIGTYVLAIAYAVFAARLPKPMIPAGGDVVKGGFGALGIVVALYLVLLVPGMRTPEKAAGMDLGKPKPPPAAAASSSGLAPSTSASAAPAVNVADSPLKAFLSDLPFQGRQAVADSLASVKRNPVLDTKAWPPRAVHGLAGAPVKIVDFTDIRCGHCRALAEAMRQIEQMAPAGSFSVEARHFPLDSECNPAVKMSDGTGMRCLVAKALVCLEGSPAAQQVHFKMFQEQETLTKERVVELATKDGGMPLKALEACIASPQTAAKIKADIDYAMSFEIEGTPLVVVNGRKATPMPAFLVAIILAEGNFDAPGFSMLPAAQMQPQP